MGSSRSAGLETPIGRRARTLLLLPGLDGTEVLFGPLVRSAPQGIEVSAVTYPRGPANRYEDLLPRVRKSLPQDRPFYLLGWSFSGPLALMAAERPPLLSGVIPGLHVCQPRKHSTTARRIVLP